MKMTLPDHPGATLSLAMHPFFVNLNTASKTYKGDVLSGLVFLKQIRVCPSNCSVPRIEMIAAGCLDQLALPVPGAEIQAESSCLHPEQH
jgi:hypothetical protein